MASSSDERDVDAFESFKRRAYTRQQPELDEDGRPTGRVLNVVGAQRRLDPKLVMDRLKRCQNCQHWDQGEDFDNRVRDHITANRLDLEAKGVAADDQRTQLARIVRPLASGHAGLCKAFDRRTPEPGEDGVSEFTHYKYRCSRWSGHIAGDGRPDRDVGEVYDELGVSRETGRPT